MTSSTFARTLPRGDLWAAQPFVTRLRQTIVALDTAVIASTIGIALVASLASGANPEEDPARRFLGLCLVGVWPTALWLRQSTSTTLLGQGPEEYRRVVGASVWTFIVVAAMAYAVHTLQARGFLVGAFLLGATLLLLERHLMRRYLHRVMARGHPLHRVFVIAAPVRARSILEEFGWTDLRFQVVGSWHLTGKEPEPSVLVDRALAAQADTIVYVPLGNDDTHWTRRLGWAMEDTDLSLLVSPSLVEIAGPRLSVEPVEGRAFVRVDMPRFSGPAILVKRGVDIVGALLGLLILGLPMLVIAWRIRRDSAGPPIYKQVRAGIKSETFECWKFRTMYMGSDSLRADLREEQKDAGACGATFKMADDPRVTTVGRRLRRYSIDELPQLVNVLRGEMSLVGPRPHPLDDVERYDDVATRRLLAKPGMTGLWQVSGRSDLNWEHAVRLDLYYVENWSLAGDLLILLRTVKVVLTGSGAY